EKQTVADYVKSKGVEVTDFKRVSLV
ncbi:hypothetical protein MNBD_BACTEROID04-866, partial [hydrothermal vent metagenome]